MDTVSISTDKSKLDVDFIHNFLTTTYWATGRTKRQVEKTIEHSLCYGIYLDDKQIGFGRVSSDQAIFAYIMDIFITPDQRGVGHSKLLMEYIMSDPRLKNIERWMLATSDANGLYSQYGFTPLEKPDYFMQKIKTKDE